ncbi:MAG: hypothetical protein AB7N80_11175 [Bdellovibrionales bacterium]
MHMIPPSYFLLIAMMMGAFFQAHAARPQDPGGPCDEALNPQQAETEQALRRYRELLIRSWDTPKDSGASLAQEIFFQQMRKDLEAKGVTPEQLDVHRLLALQESELEHTLASMRAADKAEEHKARATAEEAAAEMEAEQQVRSKALIGQQLTGSKDLRIQTLRDKSQTFVVRAIAARELLKHNKHTSQMFLFAPDYSADFASLYSVRKFFDDIDDQAFFELMGKVDEDGATYLPYQHYPSSPPDRHVYTFNLVPRLKAPVTAPVDLLRHRNQSGPAANTVLWVPDNNVQVILATNSVEAIRLHYFAPSWADELARVHQFSHWLGDLYLRDLAQNLGRTEILKLLAERQSEAEANTRAWAEEMAVAWQRLYTPKTLFKVDSKVRDQAEGPLQDRLVKLFRQEIQKLVEGSSLHASTKSVFNNMGYDFAQVQTWLHNQTIDQAERVGLLADVHRHTPALALSLTLMSPLQLRAGTMQKLIQESFFDVPEREWQLELLDAAENAPRVTAQKVAVIEDNVFRLQVNRLLTGDVLEVQILDKKTGVQRTYSTFEDVHRYQGGTQGDGAIAMYRAGAYFDPDVPGWYNLVFRTNSASFVPGQEIDVVIQGHVHDQVTEPLMQHLTDWVNPNPGHVSLYTRGKVAKGILY